MPCLDLAYAQGHSISPSHLQKMCHSIHVNQPFLQLYFDLNDNGKERKRKEKKRKEKKEMRHM